MLTRIAIVITLLGTIALQGAAQDDLKTLLERGRESLAKAMRRSGPVIGGDPNLKAAISDFDAAIKLSPRTAQAWYLRGLAEMVSPVGMGQDARASAIPFFDKTIELDAKATPAYVKRGFITYRLSYGDKDKIRKARSDFDKAIELGTKDPVAWEMRGDIRRDAKDYTGAADDYSGAIQRGAGNDAIRSRAHCYQKLGEWKKLLADRETLIQKEASSSNYAARGDAYLELKQYHRALVDYDQAISMNPKDVDHYLGRARMHRLAGNKTQALADYAKAHALDAGVPEVAADLSNADKADKDRFNIARLTRTIVENAEKLEQSYQAVEKAAKRKKRLEDRVRRTLVGDTRSKQEKLDDIALAVKDGVADEEDYVDRGIIYLGDDKVSQSVAEFTKAIVLKPDMARAYNLRGVAYETMKKWDNALGDYDKAVTLAPTNADYIRDRGDARYAKEDNSGAQRDYNEAIRLNPKDHLTYYKRGKTYFVQGDYKAAVADFDKALELKSDYEPAKKAKALAQTRLSGG